MLDWKRRRGRRILKWEKSSKSTSHEKCDIVRMMIPITDTRSPTGMQRGQREFPFQVGLSATLPSSIMSIQEDGGGYARIHYKIKANATRYGKGQPIAKEEVPLVIIAKPPSYHVPTPTCAVGEVQSSIIMNQHRVMSGSSTFFPEVISHSPLMSVQMNI